MIASQSPSVVPRRMMICWQARQISAPAEIAFLST